MIKGKLTAQTVRWFALAGPESPENYEEGWIKVDLQAGDLFILPPGFPHAVFTLEDCLFVGGQHYTAAHLARTIEGLKFQVDHPNISNEDLANSTYRALGSILRECGERATSVEKAQIRSSSSLFCDPMALKGRTHLTKADIMDILKSRGTTFNQRGNITELRTLLAELEPTAGEEFLESIRQFCRNCPGKG